MKETVWEKNEKKKRVSVNEWDHSKGPSQGKEHKFNSKHLFLFESKTKKWGLLQPLPTQAFQFNIFYYRDHLQVFPLSFLQDRISETNNSALFLKMFYTNNSVHDWARYQSTRYFALDLFASKSNVFQKDSATCKTLTQVSSLGCHLVHQYKRADPRIS